MTEQVGSNKYYVYSVMYTCMCTQGVDHFFVFKVVRNISYDSKMTKYDGWGGCNFALHDSCD